MASPSLGFTRAREPNPYLGVAEPYPDPRTFHGRAQRRAACKRPNPKVSSTEPFGRAECADLVFFLSEKVLKEKKRCERLTRPF